MLFNMNRRAFISIPVIVLLGAGLACTTKQADIDAFKVQVEQTATARALNGEDSGSANQATVQSGATATSQSLEVTQTASGITSAENDAATVTAQAPILAELPIYGVDTSVGKVAWIHPDVELQADDTNSFAYINNFATMIAKDFVIAGDITWNTQFGTSGCGFAFRSNGDKESLDQYLSIISRGGNGTALYIKMEDSTEQNFDAPEADEIDPNFQADNDTTNRLAVVAIGSHFKVYTNGVLIKEYDDTSFTRGFVAMVALSESGVTTCKFSNTWLWLISQ
jgi:hypothetical protein